MYIEGADIITSGDGNDSNNGDAGDDTIDSGDGDDTNSGGDGADFVDGGKGKDTMTDFQPGVDRIESKANCRYKHCRR